ncbi:MAG: hypothetical protein WDN45_13595 [Caulobacteraceae bacterium]
MTVEPLSSDFDALIPCLDLAGLSRNDLILVAGAGGLPAMLWLCRHGYERAMHLGPGSPRCGTETADALFIPHLSASSGLASILPAAPCVREGGVLILRTGASAAVGPAELLAAGWGLERRLTENGHAVLVARRQGGAQRKAA